MKVFHEPEAWSHVKPKAVVEGSAAQAENVLTMALHDIAQMAAEISAIRSDRDRIARNRDMWMGQVDRQAHELGRQRDAISLLHRWENVAKNGGWVVSGYDLAKHHLTRETAEFLNEPVLTAVAPQERL